MRAAEAKESREKGAPPARTRHVWLKSEPSLTEGRAERGRGLGRERLKTARARAVKGAPRAVCECGTREEAESELDAPCGWITHSNVPRMKTVARTIRESKAEILSYFDHKVTNAVLEGMDSVIQSAERLARGSSNLEYFKTVIYLNLGKLRFPQLAACATH